MSVYDTRPTSGTKKIAQQRIGKKGLGDRPNRVLFEKVFDELLCFCETELVGAACEFGGRYKIASFGQIEDFVF